MKESLKISLLIDNDSWILPYAGDLRDQLIAQGHNALLCRHADDVASGDVLFLLGCVHILKPEYLKLNKVNLVVHESDLPKGKGFAPVFWQVIEGKNDIPVCLIEAGENFDSGDIYLKDSFVLDGHELNSEIRDAQGRSTIKICMDYVSKKDMLEPTSQSGVETIYPRRRAKDSELDIHKTIDEQFNLLRTVHNDDYPAFFVKDGIKYVLKIEKENGHD